MFHNILIANPNVLNLLNADMQAAAAEFSKNGRLRTLMEEIRDEVVIPSIETNFRVGGRPSWEPITEATFRWRGEGGGRAGFIAAATGQKPLDHTGKMKRAARAKARFTIRDNEMTYGNWPAARWWAPVHNFGGQGGHIPRRQFVGLQREDIAGIEEITLNWVEDNIRRNVRRRYV